MLGLPVGLEGESLHSKVGPTLSLAPADVTQYGVVYVVVQVFYLVVSNLTGWSI